MSADLLKNFDPNAQKKAQDALAAAIETHSQLVKKQAEETAELKKQKIDPNFIKFLVAEFDLPVLAADRVLRENSGDLDVVLSKLVRNSM